MTVSLTRICSARPGIWITFCPTNWTSHARWLTPTRCCFIWPWVVDQLDRHQFAGGLILEMAAREHDSVAATLARAARGRDFLSAVLEAQTPNLSSIPAQS